MEITRNPSGDTLELRLQGRIDAHWADYVGNAVAESIRGGSHRIELNFAQVDYLSSAGLRTILNSYKQLKAVKGSLSITHPSEGALKILQLAGLAELLLSPTRATAPRAAAAVAAAQRVDRPGAVFEIYPQAPGEVLECTLTGHPEKFPRQEFGAADCTDLSFPDGALGLGLGAFGRDFADCQSRFGEFLAVAGSAAALPTDGSTVPDWLITEADLVPELKVLYGLSARGQFAQMLRFDAKPEPPGVLSLSSLVESALELSGSTHAAMVILAEAAGIVGAALRQSPGQAGAASRLEYPQAREWISSNTERSNTRNVVLIVGIASRQPTTELLPFVRPIGSGTSAQGHFHAAYFPYRPIQRGNLELKKAVTDLLSLESAQGLLHLLADERAFEGSGQTDLVRGACWVGPIARFQTSRS